MERQREGRLHFEKEVGSAGTAGADNCPRVVLGSRRLREGKERTGIGPPTRWEMGSRAAVEEC